MTDTPDSAVTIVTQTQILPGHESAFAAWQAALAPVVAAFPGFIEQSLQPPSPPTQLDWVVLQRFHSQAAAVAWLDSPERLDRLTEVDHMRAGRVDIHLVRDGEGGVLPAPVSVVIAVRVKPGQDAAYRAWEQRIAIAQSQAEGFRGYRLEPPVPGVQEDWLAILRFDTEPHLRAWFDSPQRQAILREAEPFLDAVHARVVHTGFDQWFPSNAGGKPAAWKQNMLVLLMLYPVVFLFGSFVLPRLTGAVGLPYAVAIFAGNVASVLLLSKLVPWAGGRFGWWLRAQTPKAHAAGAGVLLAIYAAMIGLFLLV